MSRFDLVMGERQIIWATMLQGIGQAIMFVPLTTLGFANIPAAMRADAAAAMTIIRYVGGSIGIAAVQALTAFNSQSMHASYAEQVRRLHPQLQGHLPGMLTPGTETWGAVINAEINRMSLMVAYVDDFWMMTVISILCAPMILLLRRTPRIQGSAPHAPMD
jgi:DHA2 family multidrug resistance protein